MTLNISPFRNYSECRVLFVAILRCFVLSGVVLTVVRLSVVVPIWRQSKLECETAAKSKLIKFLLKYNETKETLKMKIQKTLFCKLN